MTDNLDHDLDKTEDHLDATIDPTELDDRLETLYNSIVVDTDGDKIGGVGQVYLDDVTNQPTWVTVNTGFLGMKETFVPLTNATFEGETIHVPFQKEFVKDAPAIDPDGHLEAEQEDELFRYYNLGGTQAVATDAKDLTDDTKTVTDTIVTDQTAPAVDSNLGDEVVVHEERLNVSKEEVESGRVRIRKHIVTETQNVPVEVKREELVVERTPIDEVVDADHQLSEGESELILHEERPVISKQTVATEKVALGTHEVVEQQNLQAQVSKEQVEVVKDGTADSNPTT